MGDTGTPELPPCQQQELSGAQQLDQGRAVEQSGHSPWADLEWLACSDGKARPTQPGLFPLADGLQRRASKLRAYGNAIVPQVAAEFIKAALEVIGDD
jgi:DNA (cytosine-5)-methyltransferase 1